MILHATDIKSSRRKTKMNTLALGYVIPAIRAYSGVAPVRQCSCRANKIEADNACRHAHLYTMMY